MNSVKTDQENLAITATFLGFMQSALQELNKLAALGGDNYILSGCTVAGSAVSAGQLIINGELLEFKAGNQSSYVIIRENKETHNIQEGSHTKVTRWVEFGVGTGQIAWDSLKRVKTNQELETYLTNLNTDLTNEITRVENKADTADQDLQNQITNNGTNIIGNRTDIDANILAIAANVINIAAKANINHDHDAEYALKDESLANAGTGYWDVGNGLQFRWGTYYSDSDDTIVVPFLKPFTNSCHGVLTDDVMPQYSPPTTRYGFSVNRSNSLVDGSFTRFYMAVGK